MKGQHVTLPVLKTYKYAQKSVLLKPEKANFKFYW